MELSSKTEPAGASVAKDLNFSEVVAESKEKIQGAPVSEPKIKRRKSAHGGFRPGAGRKPRSAMDAQPQQGSEIQSQPQNQIAPPPDIAKYLEGPLVAISQIPASKHKIPELALSSEEAKACAQSLNEVLQAFVPDLNQMSPKTAAILGAFLTFGSIGFSKYTIYAAEIEKRAPEPKPEVQKENAEAQSSSGTAAGEYFQVYRR